jgi:2-phosphosulfolactate phosphatase
VVPVEIELVAKDASRAARRRDLIIVIDVLRATTSIVTLLAQGAMSIVPVATVREAIEIHKDHSDYLLVGERQDHKPEGFDFGNSPTELAEENLQKKNIVLTTTNGTKALANSKEARWIAIGAFLNAQALAQKAVEISSREGIGLSFVLAGEKNCFSLEDFLCAGAITERFARNAVELSDKATAALLAFKGARKNLLETVQKSRHGQDLISAGFRKDIEFACQLDVYDLVPFYKNGKVKTFP